MKKFKINDFPIFYVNLDKSNERKKKLLKNLKKFNLSANRISAVNGRELKKKEYREKISKHLGVPENKLKPEYWLNRSNFKSLSTDLDNILPRVGIFLSLMLAVKTAVEHNLNGAIFLEDDAIPMKNILNDFIIPNDADIYYLGGTFSHISKPKNSSKPYIKIDPTSLKLYGAFAFLIPNYEKLLDLKNVMYSVFNDGKSRDKHEDWRSGNIKLRAQSVDRFFVNWFQKYGNCYVTNLVKFYHPIDDKDISTINKNKFSYKKHKLTFHYHPSQDKKIQKLLTSI